MDAPVIDPIAAEVPKIESEQQVVNEPALTEDELPVIVDEPIIPK
jgi:hypothetical protein